MAGIRGLNVQVTHLGILLRNYDIAFSYGVSRKKYLEESGSGVRELTVGRYQI